MNKSEVIEKIKEIGILPVVRADSADEARRVTEAIKEGGITTVEVTMTVPDAVDLIADLSKGDTDVVFPASAMGGASYLKSLKAPLPHIKLIPTGGLSLETAADFFRAGAEAVGVGADLVDIQALREGRADSISETARKYIKIAKAA